MASASPKTVPVVQSQNFLERMIDWTLDHVCGPTEKLFSFIIKITGPGFCIGMYYLMWRHTYVYLTVICKILRKRLGVWFGMTWTTIGVVITFNVVFNHVMAMIIKPGSPTDLAVSPT
jgi:hypothetical protein